MAKRRYDYIVTVKLNPSQKIEHDKWEATMDGEKFFYKTDRIRFLSHSWGAILNRITPSEIQEISITPVLKERAN